MNIARNIILMGCTHFASQKNWREGLDLGDFTADKLMSGVPKTADINTPTEELIDISRKQVHDKK
jgi:hypothetical protein